MKMIQKIGRGRGLLGEVERVLILPPEDPFIYIYIYIHTHTHTYVSQALGLSLLPLD